MFYLTDFCKRLIGTSCKTPLKNVVHLSQASCCDESLEAVVLWLAAKPDWASTTTPRRALRLPGVRYNRCWGETQTFLAAIGDQSQQLFRRQRQHAEHQVSHHLRGAANPHKASAELVL